MSSKRKCIVILLFIVLVTILFILYNRSQFFLGISYRCKYSVYEVHSKSFKNHSNLPVNHSLSPSFFQNVLKKHRRLLPMIAPRYDSKLGKNVSTTTDLPPLVENSVKMQNFFLLYAGLNDPSNVTKYKECPESRVLTVLFTGRLGNVIWEYMSLIAVEELYNDRLNMQAFMPGNMKLVLELLFEEVDAPEIVDLPISCISMRHAQLIRRNEKPKYEPAAPYNSPLILDAFSCRYQDVIYYGLDRIRAKLRFQKRLSTRIASVLMDIKSTFNFNHTERVTFVAVHYRGEDYNTMLNKIYPEKFKGPPSYRYYKNAMQYFNGTIEKVIFVLVSSDVEWLQANAPHFQDFKVVVNPLGSNSSIHMVDDFVMLSSCNHSIINYGTYATASAFLAGGTTIVYDVNLPKDGRGYSLAISIVSVLSNWFLCNELKCNIKY